MIVPSLLCGFFPMAITLHNLEEALWLPQRSDHAKPFHKPVEPSRPGCFSVSAKLPDRRRTGGIFPLC